MADKVEEIATTHALRRLDYASNDESAKVRGLLEGIYGVGPKTSLIWYQQGVKTLKDALARDDLTAAQRIGIQYYDDFKKRIPRAETRRHFETVQEVVRKLDPTAKCMCMGSYRRGRPETGDIDIIITREGAEESNVSLDHITKDQEVAELREVMMKTLIELFQSGFLQCTLAGPSPEECDWDVDRMVAYTESSSHRGGSTSGKSKKKSSTKAASSASLSSKWHGGSMLSDVGICRRIDFLVVPRHELGASLLYFTGNDIFNRAIRLLARQKGYALNQHGLYKNVVRSNNRSRSKTTDGELVEGRSERKIFEILGVPWREPEDRNEI